MTLISTTVKSISLSVMSATNSPLRKAFAMKSNEGDITAKNASMSSLAAMLGIGFGVMLEMYLSEFNSLWRIWLVSVLLFIASIFTVYKANNYAALTSLNTQRTEILFYHMFSKNFKEDNENELSLGNITRIIYDAIINVDSGKSPQACIPSPEDVAKEERFLFCKLKPLSDVPIYEDIYFLKTNLSKLPYFHDLCEYQLGLGQKYIVIPFWYEAKNQYGVYLRFLDTIDDKDRLRAIYHAYIYRFILHIVLKASNDSLLKFVATKNKLNADGSFKWKRVNFHEMVIYTVTNTFDKLCPVLEKKGWKVENVFFGITIENDSTPTSEKKKSI